MSTDSPAPTPANSASEHAPEPVAAPATGQPAATLEVPRPKRRTSVANLILALAVTFGIVGLLVLIVPRPNAIVQPAADVAGAAKGASSELSFTPAVFVPAGWKPTTANVRRSTGDLPTWTVNYLTDKGRYAGLMQAGGWNQKWQSSLTQGGVDKGTVQINGHTWQVLVKEEKGITTLMLKQSGLTTLVQSKDGGVADATALAQGLSLNP